MALKLAQAYEYGLFIGKAQPHTVGQVTLGISLEPTRARQRQILLNSLLLTSAVLAAAILMALRLRRDIVRAIGLLAQAVEKIGQGNLQVRLGGELGGEFTVLKQGIIRMAEELRGFYDTLQSRIQEATAKLSWQASHDPLAGLANRAEFGRLGPEVGHRGRAATYAGVHGPGSVQGGERHQRPQGGG